MAVRERPRGVVDCTYLVSWASGKRWRERVSPQLLTGVTPHRRAVIRAGRSLSGPAACRCDRHRHRPILVRIRTLLLVWTGCDFRRPGFGVVRHRFGDRDFGDHPL